MHHLLLRCTLVAAAAAATLTAQKFQFAPAPPFWAGHGRDPAHTGLVTEGTQPLNQIKWSTPVDLQPQYTGTYLLIHYGSPLVTAQGRVLVTVKTGAAGGFQVECRQPSNGALLWTQTTDYVLPPHNWVPSCGSTLTPLNQLATPAAGGTILLRNDADSATSAAARLAFYGLATYQANQAAFDAAVQISTPITSDSNGNLYFGFRVAGALPIALQSGLARIDRNGTGSWVSASTAATDPSIRKVVFNCAPAITADGRSLYVTVNSSNNSGASGGYLLKLDAATLAMQARVRLKDVAVPSIDAYLHDDGTASPTIGPDGEVYIGVLENPFGTNHLRGWLRHFDANLTTSLIPGPFGWDDTASIVPRSMLPQYTGTSSYLVLTKYNNYGSGGGDGLNRLGVFDPHASMVDPISGALVMNKVIDVLAPTPDPTFPGGVREWCINTAAIDVPGKSAIVNCEDGKVYRWHLPTNTLSQGVALTIGIGEAYTSTIIGMDGMCFAINDARLYAVGR
ncbi:MAG TPA: hypothetical protein VF384_10715 [Planctomycetota bacterium]